jgi:hypothetical protein
VLAHKFTSFGVHFNLLFNLLPKEAKILRLPQFVQTTKSAVESILAERSKMISPSTLNLFSGKRNGIRLVVGQVKGLESASGPMQAEAYKSIAAWMLG